MKKRLNSMFFGICFIAALLTEVYCIQTLKGDLFSIIGIGIVVLIMGYLLIDSIRESITSGTENTKSYLDQIRKEEGDRWVGLYSELINLQKATYSATKRNSVLLEKQLEQLLYRIDAIENNNGKALERMLELQKKSLEGQMKALNLEIKNDKENAKQLLKAIQEEGNRRDYSEQLRSIIDLLEENKELLNIYAIQYEYNENVSEQIESADADSEPETEEIDNSIIQSYNKKVIPLYDDPNKALTADEIASLFASYGNN